MSCKAYPSKQFAYGSPTSSSCSDDDSNAHVSPTQLLALAIRKRRELFEEKDCDLKRQIFHTDMIRTLCKHVGEGRARHRRSRHRPSKKSQKRRWDDDGKGQTNSDNLYIANATATTETAKECAKSSTSLTLDNDERDSGFESTSPDDSPPSPLSMPILQNITADKVSFSRNGNDNGSLNNEGIWSAKRLKFSRSTTCFGSGNYTTSISGSTEVDFMECDPFGLDNLCTPPDTDDGNSYTVDGLPENYSMELCHSSWTFEVPCNPFVCETQFTTIGWSFDHPYVGGGCRWW